MTRPAPRRAKAPPARGTRRRGFTMVELLVLLGIVLVLVSIFVPYLLRQHESANRVRCANNLKQLYIALRSYEDAQGNFFPSAARDSDRSPDGYTAYTGPDAPDPFAGVGQGGRVAANDATASLWLLVRYGYAHPALFVCPSAGGSPDRLTDAAGRPAGPRQRSNFRSPANLGYSYCSPFTSAPKFYLADWLPWKFAVLADRNPGAAGGKTFQGRGGVGDDVTAPAYTAPPLDMARANSNNHRKSGQNVLYPAGNVSFERTPYCGVDGDNIFTALSLTPLPATVTPDMKATGYCAPTLGPALAEKDSYLVPTDDDGR